MSFLSSDTLSDHGLYPETVWRLGSSATALAEACSRLDLEPAMVELEPVLEEAGALPGIQRGTIEFPSAYCQEKDFFVLVLAFLVQHHRPIEVSLRRQHPETGEILFHAALFPRLDSHTLQLLARIDLGMAQEMANLNESIEQVFDNMQRQVTFDSGAGPHRQNGDRS